MIEEHISVNNYISAIGRLYQYSQNKRLHVTHNEFVKDEVGNIAIYINDVIKMENGIDIFNDSSEEDIKKYEDILTKTISEYATNNISHRDMTDETEILKKAIIVNNDTLKDKEISVSPPLEDKIKSFPLTTNQLIALCKNPTILSFFKGYSKDIRENYILISTVIIKDCSYYVVIHLCNESGKKNNLNIITVFFLTNDTFNQYIENPIMAFLSRLDVYGLNITINKKTKKIFGKETINLTKPFDELLDIVNILHVDTTDKSTFSLSLKKINNKCIKVEFVYGVNYTKYLSDLKRDYKKI